VRAKLMCWHSKWGTWGTDYPRFSWTRSLAIIGRPFNVLHRLKSCQPLLNCTKTHIWKGLQQAN